MPTPAVLRTRAFLVSSAVVLAGGATAAAFALTGNDNPGQALAPATGATSNPATPTPEPTPPAADVTTTPTPALTTQPAATPTPAPRATTSPRSYPFATPTTSYSPLTLTFTTDQTSGTTQTAFTFDAHATDGDGFIDIYSINWGDSEWRAPISGAGACAVHPSPTADPGPYRPHPDQVSAAFGHAWRHAGTYTVTIHAGSGSPRPCGDGQPRDYETIERSLRVTITDDDVITTNGPADPVFGDLDVDLDAKRHEAILIGNAYDTDGYISRVVIDYGDGTAPVDDSGFMEYCRDMDGKAYPDSGQAYRGTEVGPSEQPAHRYAHGGHYTITITVSSAGCSGADTQTSSVLANITV